MQTKICLKCKLEKSIKDFYKQKNGLLGVRGSCKTCESIIDAEYRDKNRELLRQKDRDKYWSRNPQEKEEYIKKKSIQNQNRFKTSPEARERRKLYGKSNKGKFSQYRHDAERRDYEFCLTYEQFIELLDKECHYCSTTPSRGIDRVNNKQGYIIENCVPCCGKCNIMKRDSSLEEFYSHIEKIYQKKIKKLSKE